MQLFHSSIDLIIRPLFKNGTPQFDLKSIEYWTQIDQNQQFITIDVPYRTKFGKLPPLIKRHNHHIIDLNVQYSMQN